MIKAPLPQLSGVSFHVGKDENKRTRYQFAHFLPMCRWFFSIDQRMVFAFQCTEPMHILGAPVDHGLSARLDVEPGEFVAIDFVNNIVEKMLPMSNDGQTDMSN